jgi:hypothetical protein
LPKELASRTGTSLQKLGSLTLLLLLAAFAILVQGYHPGLEDDAFYLAAIKQDLNPSLFPHCADFFRVQFQATVFDKLIAFSLRWTHVPLEWGILFWQWAVTVLILWGCWRISRRCFAEAHAQWAAVTLVAVLLTLPVSGTGLSLTDQHLHPRALATALILAAIVAVLVPKNDKRLLLAGALLAAAFAVHAIMAAFGASYCLFLLWKPAERMKIDRTAVGALLLWPLGWIFEPPSDAWRQAAATRSFYFVLRWHWYEWLGVVAPGAGRAPQPDGSGACGGAVGVLWRVPVGGGANNPAARPAGAFASPRADALSASCVLVVCVAGGGIAWAVRAKETCTALASAVCAAERRDVLCAAADVSGNRASGTAGPSVA